MNEPTFALPGRSYPLGAMVYPEGINFSLYSKNAIAVELLLFDAEDHSEPATIIVLDPEINRTFHYWHAFVPNLKTGQVYAYRVHGHYAPEKGHRFDGEKVLLDPYGTAVVTENYDRAAAKRKGDNCAQAMKNVAIDFSNYDWEGDHPLDRPFANTIIYELHVGGFTKHPNSGLTENLRGTYRGVIEKIPYLKQLGVTAVELMPVQQFDPCDTPSDLRNYWGYSPIAFFAPHNGYGSSDDPCELIDEFRDMVKALHKAGIEVILDVVFNHTTEANHEGPTLSFRGIENRAYYMLKENPSLYRNFSGTGNTLNTNHSVVRRLIIDCLRHWVSEYHIDGFRFDLASVLSRDEKGEPIKNPPILWAIESDPVLAPIKIIAEAWDIGQYQLGNFVGDKWAEWNGKFRDDVRRFIKGDRKAVQDFVPRLSASRDLFSGIYRDPNRSINFVTCHDGFTMKDLVSYNEKHNFANKENNQDGHNTNHSWNCGVEGATDDPEIQQLRFQQMRNFFTLLLISQGTPMLLMGDEVGRTQNGNNNAYCQDNKISWMDWSLLEKNKELFKFVQQLIQYNLKTEFFQEAFFWNSPNGLNHTTITLHGTRLIQPDLSDHSHSIAFTLSNPEYRKLLHVMINAYWEPLTFELPKPLQNGWQLIIDTDHSAEGNIFPPDDAPQFKSRSKTVAARSIVLLQSEC